MVQAANWSVPLIGPASPSVMASRMDDSLDALLSAHGGSSAPTYKMQGTLWLDTTSSSALKLMMWDGAAWRTMWTLDASTGKVTLPAQDYATAFTSVAAATLSITAADDRKAFSVDVARPSTAITLPASASISLGWSCIIRATGTPVNGSSQVFQVAYVASQGTDDLIYNGVSHLVGGARRFVLMGYNEMFRFTWTSFGWLIELIADGAGKINSFISRSRNPSGGFANSGITSWAVLPLDTTPSGTNLQYNWSTSEYFVPVSGWYTAHGWNFSAYGSVLGAAYLGIGNTTSNPAAYDQKIISIRSTADSGYVIASTSVNLNQGDRLGLYHQESATGVFWYPDNGYFKVQYMGRA